MERELEDAYLRTSYWVEAPHKWIRLRAGEVNADLEELLRARRERTWAFVSADNPRSKPLPPSENALRRAELREAIERLDRVAFPGVGIGDDGDWPPETSFFVLGIAEPAAVELGRRFGQNAILFGVAGEAPRLLACTPF